MPHAVVIIHDRDPDVVAAAVARVAAATVALPVVVQTLTTGGSLGWQDALDAVLKTRGLNAKECALVRLDQEGLSRAAIAAELTLSPASITAYWKLIYDKLGLADRAALRQWLSALRQQMAHGGEASRMVGE